MFRVVLSHHNDRVSGWICNFTGFGAETALSPAIVSTTKIRQAGLHDAMDTEAMFRKWFRLYQDTGLLPRPTHK